MKWLIVLLALETAPQHTEKPNVCYNIYEMYNPSTPKSFSSPLVHLILPIFLPPGTEEALASLVESELLLRMFWAPWVE